MSASVLKFINDQLTAAGINYEFGQWSGSVVYPYFVGEYTENEPTTEDGLIQTTFMLNGFSRGSWVTLENAKATIEKLFSSKIELLESGSGVGIFYVGTIIIPQNEPELKRIQINLTIKEWKVN